MSKLADYLISLQTSEFQIQQWLLITDTPDSKYPTPDYVPEALLDSISVAITEKYGDSKETRAADAQALRQSRSTPGYANGQVLRRPLLQASNVETVQALQPFFASVSRAFYDGECACTGIDWDNINDCLLRELFEPIHVHDAT